MQSNDERLKRREVVNHLCDLLLADERLRSGLAALSKEFSDHFPLSRERLQKEGVPILLVLRLAEKAIDIGVGGLPAPPLLILTAVVRKAKAGNASEDVVWRPEIPLSPSDTRASFMSKVRAEASSFWDHGLSPLRRADLHREVRWFYSRFCLLRTIEEIADEAGYSVERTQRGITHARRLLGVVAGPGRPRKAHYSARTV
jgi:hypothetical protein